MTLTRIMPIKVLMALVTLASLAVLLYTIGAPSEISG